MKHLFTVALIALASPALAGWYFEASVEGGAEYWTFTNETGEVSPRRVRGNEIWITRTDQMNELDANGTCDFNNCRVSVTLGPSRSFFSCGSMFLATDGPSGFSGSNL